MLGTNTFYRGIMKFANLIMDEGKGMINVGDWVQIFAIENLYLYMGIDLEDVVRIKVSELSTYNGEYVILPLNIPMYGYYNLSKKIIPVFLGVSVINGAVAKGLRMQMYQPIGCRDYHTLQELGKEGLDVYYGGCLTITFPKRKEEPREGKVFIVDVSDKVMQGIPDAVRKDAEYITHVLYGDECLGEKEIRKMYERYAKEASLVITSRIHCAQPCLAAGIPVVFICEVKSFRYDVIRQFIPVYTLDDFDRITWDPDIIDIEEHKELMLKNAADRVWAAYKKYNMIGQVSDYYLSGQVLEYEIDSFWAFERYVKARWGKEDYFEYGIWGITQVAETLYTWICDNYPNAVLKLVLDIVSSKVFHGIKAQGMEAMSGCVFPIFVTAGAANSVAEETFKKYNVKEYVVCYNNLYIVDGKHFDY